MRGQQLLLDAPDRQHASLQGHLTRHADTLLHRTAGQQRCQRRRHRDAGRRSVLRDRARRHMQVELALLEGRRRDTELLGVRTHVRQRDVRRLGHDVAELTRDLQTGLTLHTGDLDRQHVATGTRHRKTGGETGNRRAGRVLGTEPAPADVLLQVGFVDDDRRDSVDVTVTLDLGDTARRLASDGAELTFQTTNACFTRPTADERMERGVGDFELVLAQTGLLPLAREQVVLRDRDLLVLGVAVELDDLHAVEQRRRDRLQHIRRGEEQDVRQVEVELQVVVTEGVVLRGVQDLQQRGRRIAAPPSRLQLVDLVDEHDRVHRLGLGQRAHDASGARTDIGTPVTSDLRLVAHTADRNTHERPSERARHRFTE